MGVFSLSLTLSFFFSLSGYPTVSGPVLTLSNAVRASLFSSRSLVADTSIWATSPQELQLGAYSVGFFFFFLPVMLPSEIPKLPTDPQVRGFPGVWKLFLLHDSLPGSGLHP